MQETPNFVIPAKCHSDTHHIQIDFDAVEYFSQCDFQDVVDLANCQWGGDYPADRVAEWFKETTTKTLFTYLDCIAESPACEDMRGFECEVDDEAATKWLRENRPDVYLYVHRDKLPGKEKAS